ncbi:protein TESPA1 [Tiliqua scincoides]|uniref:protein TESPA1 n=1 Tax=Tiliqua scincoides TaxID=71010 RepID=UPI0034618344
MENFTPWLRQSSWERRQAWAKRSCMWHSVAVEDEVPDAPQEALQVQPPSLVDGFLPGSSSNKIETWLEECSSSVEPFPEGISGPLANESCSNRTSFEDDLSLGAEATLLLDKDRGEFRSQKGMQWPYQHLNLDHSMASSALSGSTNKTSSSISEVLERCEVDAETVLSNLGFIEEETKATSWIPARFFAVPSQAKGIDFQLFLRAQVQRLEMEDPCLMLATRFKQVQTLAATADAFFCLYSYVSKTPVQKFSPAHLFGAFPEIPGSWDASSNSEALTPLQRLQRAVSKMCLYTSPRGEPPKECNMRSPMSRLEQIAWEVMEKIRHDRLHLGGENIRGHTGPTGDSFCQSNLGSTSSETTIMETASMASSSSFGCKTLSHSGEKADLVFPELEPWLSRNTEGASMKRPNHFGYPEPYRPKNHSPQRTSSQDESSDDSEVWPKEQDSTTGEDCVN